MKSDSDSALIKLRGLTLRRGRRSVLDELNVSFPRAGLVALLGGNGAGKSSLLRILAGVSEATSGTVNQSGELRLGWMAEPARFYLQLTVKEQLLLQADLLALPEPVKVVNQLMNQWQLERVSQFRTEHLSLGYRQRLSLAQALMGPVDVLLLDEPMNGMDPELMQQFKTFLADIKQHKLVILATHLMAEISDLTDWALVLHQGRLLAKHDYRHQRATAVDLMHLYQTSLSDWQQAAANG